MPAVRLPRSALAATRSSFGDGPAAVAGGEKLGQPLDESPRRVLGDISNSPRSLAAPASWLSPRAAAGPRGLPAAPASRLEPRSLLFGLSGAAAFEVFEDVAGSYSGTAPGADLGGGGGAAGPGAGVPPRPVAVAEDAAPEAAPADTSWGLEPEPPEELAGVLASGMRRACLAHWAGEEAGAAASSCRSRRGSPCGAPPPPCAASAREGAAAAGGGPPGAASQQRGAGGAGLAAGASWRGASPEEPARGQPEPQKPWQRQPQGPAAASSRGCGALPAAAAARASRQRAPPAHQFLPAQRLQAERIQRQRELEAERERSEQIIQELRLSGQERREVAARTRQLEEEIASLRGQMRQISQLDTVAQRQKQLEGSLRLLQEECATEAERRRLIEGELARMQDELGGRIPRLSQGLGAQECSLTASSLTFEVPAGGRADARSSLGASTIDLPAAGLLAGAGSGRSSLAGHTDEAEASRPGRVHELIAVLEGRRERPAASPQEDLLSICSPMMPGEPLSAHAYAGTGPWA